MYVLIIFVYLQAEDNTGRGDREASLVPEAPETIVNFAEGTTVMASKFTCVIHNNCGKY